MKRTVYLVFSDRNGLVDVVGSKEKAQKAVETISCESYGLIESEEIWNEDFENGNELCYYEECEVEFDD